MYEQAGDIWIYNSFKDKISPLISEWKSSGTIELNHGIGAYLNENAWRNVELYVINKSIVGAGFHNNFEEWHITRHDVVGAHFKWVNDASKQKNDLHREGEADGPLLPEDKLKNLVLC